MFCRTICARSAVIKRMSKFNMASQDSGKFMALCCISVDRPVLRERSQCLPHLLWRRDLCSGVTIRSFNVRSLMQLITSHPSALTLVYLVVLLCLITVDISHISCNRILHRAVVTVLRLPSSVATFLRAVAPLASRGGGGAPNTRDPQLADIVTCHRSPTLEHWKRSHTRYQQFWLQKAFG